jgi:rSAM/selenodomain-associated transferase 1
MQHPDTRILIFARAPEAGKTKTRLIPALGTQGAAELHRRMTLQLVTSISNAHIATIELLCYPDTRHEFFMQLHQQFGINLNTQHGRNLGERMSTALSNSLHQCQHTLIIGTDAPAITPAYLQTAIEKLKSGYEVVLGPAVDGGYVLIGMSQHHATLFENIDWGTKHVLAQTLERINQNNLSHHTLETLWDVDTPDDMAKLRNDTRFTDLLNNPK